MYSHVTFLSIFVSENKIHCVARNLYILIFIRFIFPTCDNRITIVRKRKNLTVANPLIALPDHRRRYMTVKAQEKKSSQREVQLERKVKSLEEELEKAQAQLDRKYLAQEAKKAKVHFFHISSITCTNFSCNNASTKILKYRADGRRTLTMGEAKEVATNRRKLEGEAQGKDRGAHEIIHELRETSVSGLVHGTRETIFKE